MIPRTLVRLCLVVPPLACGFEESATGYGATLPNLTTSSTPSTTEAPTPTTSGGASTGPAETTDAASSSSTTTSTTSATSTTSTTSTTGPDPSGTTSSSSGEPGTSSSGTTEPPAPTCDDGALNQDETDVDCGGACSPCLDGQVCGQASDCVSGLCEAGTCAPGECQNDLDCAGLASACAAASCEFDTKKCLVAPINEGGGCDDGDPCTQVDACAAGLCVGASPIDCSGLDAFCGVGVCDPQSGQCTVAGKKGMEGAPCDDGFPCTFQDACAEGVCGTGGPGYALFEDFSGDAPGWTLGPTWEVGPALASPAALSGADPAGDHSPGDDNRLAGVLIGGLSSGPPEAKTCLTSPPVDTTGKPTAWVTYWRHLHTDYYPYVINQIEVFDGIDWVELEIGYDNPGIDDPNWQQFYLDLAPYSHEALQVRICYTRKPGATAFAGWSVDDVTIGESVCTPE